MKYIKNLTALIIGIIVASCGSGSEPAWQEVQIKDEFGDIIEGESTIAADFEGTMSNSAVSGADLTVRMQVEDSTIFSIFYEYSRKPQAQLPNSEYLTIKVKISNGEVLEATQLLYGNMMVDSRKELLKILLSQNEPVNVIADISSVDRYGSTVYRFEIDPNGLKEGLIKNKLK